MLAGQFPDQDGDSREERGQSENEPTLSHAPVEHFAEGVPSTRCRASALGLEEIGMASEFHVPLYLGSMACILA